METIKKISQKFKGEFITQKDILRGEEICNGVDEDVIADAYNSYMKNKNFNRSFKDFISKLEMLVKQKNVYQKEHYLGMTKEIAEIIQTIRHTISFLSDSNYRNLYLTQDRIKPLPVSYKNDDIIELGMIREKILGLKFEFLKIDDSVVNMFISDYIYDNFKTLTGIRSLINALNEDLLKVFGKWVVNSRQTFRECLEMVKRAI